MVFPKCASRSPALAMLMLMLGGVLMTGCGTVSPPVDRTQPLVELIEKRRQEMRIPGAVVGVYQRGKTLVQQGFGTTDVKAVQMPDAKTLFRVASVSKLFIGAVALRLAERGVISLDDPISKYCNDVPDGERMTLRMLGNNTAGVRNFISLREVKAEFAAHPQKVWKREELIQLGLRGKPHFTPPGSGWIYSNTNALLLVSALEKATGKTWNTLLGEEVLRPLGLKQTRVAHDIPAGLARGYQYGDEKGPIAWKGAGTVLHDVTADSPSKWGASGDLVSSLSDLQIFMRALVGKAYLSAESRAEQRKWIKTGYPVDYRYGFAMSAYEDTVGHSGMIPGYQACVAYHEATDSLVIVLANVYSTPNWEEPANYLFFSIMEWLTGRRYTPRL